MTCPGRRAAQARIRCLEVSLRSGARTGSGAVKIRASICAPAWMRPFIAPRRATRRTRIISTCASRDFGVPVAHPDCTARAADSAPRGSDLPLRRRLARSGRSTSITARPYSDRNLSSPVPKLPVPSIPTLSTGPNDSAQVASCAGPGTAGKPVKAGSARGPGHGDPDDESGFQAPAAAPRGAPPQPGYCWRARSPGAR